MESEPESKLKQNLIRHIKERNESRKTKWSDILFFFLKKILKDPANRFHSEPSRKEIFDYLSYLIQYHEDFSSENEKSGIFIIF